MLPFPSSLAIPLAAVLLVTGLSGGWYARGLQCDVSRASREAELQQSAQRQRELKQQIEARQATVTEQSTQRLDAQAARQQPEIQYVEKEVIHYRDRWRERACALPADWLRLYNASLFGPAGGLPAPSEPRSTADRAGL